MTFKSPQEVLRMIGTTYKADFETAFLGDLHHGSVVQLSNASEQAPQNYIHN